MYHNPKKQNYSFYDMLSLTPIKLTRLFYFAWPRVSSESDAPATSDCLGPYFSVCFFPIIACVLTFLGPSITF